jgi:hypothetical protein
MALPASWCESLDRTTAPQALIVQDQGEQPWTEFGHSDDGDGHAGSRLEGMMNSPEVLERHEGLDVRCSSLSSPWSANSTSLPRLRQRKGWAREVTYHAW